MDTFGDGQIILKGTMLNLNSSVMHYKPVDEYSIVKLFHFLLTYLFLKSGLACTLRIYSDTPVFVIKMLEEQSFRS